MFCLKVVFEFRSTPWTDGIGSQETYVPSVQQWFMVHESLIPNNPNKVNNDLRGICLSAQLHGRAKDLCKGLTAYQLRRNDAPSIICSILSQSDTMPVSTDVSTDLINLRTCKHKNGESFKNYELRFSAMMAKFNANGSSIELPESVYTLYLL